MSDIDSTPSEKRDVYRKVTDAIINAAQGGFAGHFHGGIEGSESLRWADSAGGAGSVCPGGGGVTGGVVPVTEGGGHRAAPFAGASPRVRPPQQGREHPSRLPRRLAELLPLVRGAGPSGAARITEAVAAYIAECAGRLKVGSVQRRLNAIAEAHKASGYDSPIGAGIVRATLKGIRRTLGTAPSQKVAALTADIRAMVDATDVGLIGARDRALILFGFAGAFRRSELVALDFADLAFSHDGLTVTLQGAATGNPSVSQQDDGRQSVQFQSWGGPIARVPGLFIPFQYSVKTVSGASASAK